MSRWLCQLSYGPKAYRRITLPEHARKAAAHRGIASYRMTPGNVNTRDINIQ